MRTSSIIALALTAALFGYYLLGEETFQPVPGIGVATDAAKQVAREPHEPGTVGRDTILRNSPADALNTSSRDCTIDTRYVGNADGTATMLLACDRNSAVHRHEYERYPTDALSDLAWSDAVAAEVLGMRLRERDRAAAMSLVIRAAALAGGDPAPILAYSNAYPEPTSIDGVLLRETVHTRFVLAAVAELLGAGPNLLPYWENQIQQVSTDPQREIRLLRDRARRLVDEMQRIELEVTGSSTFGGQGDA